MPDVASTVHSSSSRQHRAIEFFAGIGGLHCALVRACTRLDAKATVLCAYDVDDSAVATYRQNYQGTKVSTRNVVAINEADLAAWTVPADVWLLSPPCQPHTRQGNQLASEDARSHALLHLLDLLEQARLTPITEGHTWALELELQP